MKKLMLLIIIAAMLFTVSCSKKYIKGTQIEENEDSKAILTIFAHYVKGFRDQNPEIFTDYISEKYYDSNGTDDARDDVDHDKVMEMLNSEQFKSLKKVDIVYIMKDLQIDKKTDTAKLLFYFEVRFKMTSNLEDEGSGEDQTKESFIKPDGMTNHKISDNNQMKFVKEGDNWKIVSGL